MNNALYTNVNRYRITASCIEPMHIGSGDGEQGKGEILIHSQNNLPFIQATGIAGAFGEYVEKNYGNEARKQLFGDSHADKNKDARSRLVFSDGDFDKNTMQIELRNRVSIDKKTGTVKSAELKSETKHSGQVLSSEYISTGSRFVFTVTDYYDDSKKETSLASIEDCLAALHMGIINLGGQVSNGCGLVKLDKIELLACDLTKKEDRQRWAKEEGYKEVTKRVLTEKRTTVKTDYEVSLEVTLDRSLLIRGNFVDVDLVERYTGERKSKEGKENRVPDVMNIVNGKQQFILPATSIKGAFRDRMEMIAGYLQIPKKFLDIIFENRAKIYFHDAVIDEESARQIARIHINKLSGGVMNNALFSELPVSGKAKLKIIVKKWDRENNEQVLAALGLLLYAIRDLAIGAFSFGGDASVGRGFVNVDQISVLEEQEEKVKIVDHKVLEGEKFIEKVLKNVSKMRGGVKS